MQFCFLKDDKEPERNESTTLILQLTMLKCSCLHIMRHHHAFFVYTDFCKENRLKLTLLLCTAVWNKVDFWFRRKDRHDTEYTNMPEFAPTERELFSRYRSRRHRAAAAHRDPCLPLTWLTRPSSSPLHKPTQP